MESVLLNIKNGVILIYFLLGFILAVLCKIHQELKNLNN